MFPDLEISGGNFPPSQTRQTIAMVATTVSWSVIVILLLGDYIFSALGIAPPQMYKDLKETQGTTMMMAFLLGSVISQAMTKTGAFEITLNGQVVWSKLETGRVPEWNELVDIMKSHLSP
eukprot:m.7369 g.7369  ORF g.7369 m.7369 type:complete len:120 (+) comp5240_c0_seq1:478-837(+)